jgi:hypothetical protein
MRYYLQYRSTLTSPEGRFVDVRDYPEELLEASRKLLASFSGSMTEEQLKTMILYLTIGSQNQDYRGMIMDGEAALVVAGQGGLTAFVDLFFLVGLTTWVDDEEELKELLPPQKGWKRWVGRYIMKAL